MLLTRRKTKLSWPKGNKIFLARRKTKFSWREGRQKLFYLKENKMFLGQRKKIFLHKKKTKFSWLKGKLQSFLTKRKIIFTLLSQILHLSEPQATFPFGKSLKCFKISYKRSFWITGNHLVCFLLFSDTRSICRIDSIQRSILSLIWSLRVFVSQRNEAFLGRVPLATYWRPCPENEGKISYFMQINIGEYYTY